MTDTDKLAEAMATNADLEEANAQLEGKLESAWERRDQAEAKLAQIRNEHPPHTDDTGTTVCPTCHDTWPCATTRIAGPDPTTRQPWAPHADNHAEPF